MKKSKKRKVPVSLGTSSLSDIIFMLLFFFMIVTVLRKQVIKVEITLPKVSEAKKMNHKSLINHIYVGKPIGTTDQAMERIQINDAFINIEEIPLALDILDRSRPERMLPKVTTALVIDEEVKMGHVGDIKTELRKANRLKINYNSLKTLE